MEDVELAAACARGDSQAIATFEERYFGEVGAAYAKIRPPVTLDEAKQAIRDRLFVAREGEPPRIALYSGEGALRSWFRVMATRTLLNLATRGPREKSLEDSLLAALPAEAADPELDHARRLYAHELQAAFAEAAARLSTRDRALLRYAFQEGLTVDAVGAIYGVHRATAARWIAKAKDDLVAGVHAALRARLKIGPSELESVLRLLESRAHVTISRYLKDA